MNVTIALKEEALHLLSMTLPFHPGTVSNGLMMSSIGKLLSEKLDVLRLTFYTAPLTCFVLLPFYYSLEDARYKEYHVDSTNNAYMGKED